MKLRLHRIFICQAFAMLRNVQQRKLRLSPFEQHGVPFTLVVAESDIFPVNVPVASLQLSDQFAFGYLPAPQKTGQRTARRMVLSSCGRTKPQHCKASEAQKDRPELQDPGRYFFVCRGRAEAIHAAFGAIHAGFVLLFAKIWYASLKAYPPP